MAMELAVVANGAWGDIDLIAGTESGIIKVDLENIKVPELTQLTRENNYRVFAGNHFSLSGAIIAYEKIYRSLGGA